MDGHLSKLKTPQRKLSFGQRKRCELVAALLHHPKVIFLDEPTNAMDLINAKKVREFIKETGRERKQTIIITSHNMSDIEQVCGRIIIINQGKIAFDGNIRDLGRRDGANKRVKVIFNGPWPVAQVEKLGKILERNGQEILLEVDPERITSVASQLF